nr:hypothetical protein [Tanacetum cinerariifolium]
MKTEGWNQDLIPTGKLLQPFGQGFIWSVGNEKEFGDLRKHRTGRKHERKEHRRENSWSIGKIPLEITIGDPPLIREETLNFMIVKSGFPYNMLLGRKSMQKRKIVVTTIHGAIKFTTRGIGMVFLTHKSDKGMIKIQMAKGDEDKTAFFAVEWVFCYRKMPFGLKNAGATYQRLVDKVFYNQIGRNLEAYVDDMVIKSTTEEEMLADIKKTFERFRSINMKLNPKKCSFCIEEGPLLGHLITKQGIRANPSKVKVIIDAEQPKTLKDVQSLNRKIVTFSHFLSKGAKRSLPFIKIQMAKGDEDKTAFFAVEWVFCYRKMPFGLKNAGATYQRLVDKVFYNQIGRNLEAYVDDMVIKSTTEEEMLADIKKTFERFRSINMKLNPKKCSFCIEEGPLLGHLITKQGIRANPSKVKVIIDAEQPKTLKDVQSLNRKIVTFSHFLSKGAKRSLPFIKEAELNYLRMENLILSLVHVAKRLRRYFQTHMTTVLTNSPIKQTLTKPKKLGRVAKWVIKLGDHNIVFQERGDKTPKDFLIEVPLKDNKKKAEEKVDLKSKKMELSCKWKLFTDGAASSDGFGAGLICNISQF